MEGYPDGGESQYLCVFLGAGSNAETFELWAEKCVSRCFDLSPNMAAWLPTTVGYNERAVPVISCVSQGLIHQGVPRFKGLEQTGVHKIPKLLPKCMKHKLLHSFGHFCPVSPKAVFPLRGAGISRFSKAGERAISKI